MHHFIIEFITGGGMTGLSLPESLQKEGGIMLQTLIRDLIDAGHDQISATRDTRCKLETTKIKQHFIESTLQDELPGLINNVDVIWLVAPETDDILASLIELLLKSDATVITCSPKSVRMTASKYTTFNILNDSNIDVIETCLKGQSIPDSSNGWIIKPDDGVGAEKCQLILDKQELNQFISASNNNYIVQPYLSGEHLSMSLLVYEDNVRLLSCNKQYVDWADNKPVITAIGVNECLELKEGFQRLSEKIVKVIPGLGGYIGVDLIKTDKSLKVVEINPRFTTALAGLSKSLGINTTETILNVFLTGKLPDIDLSKASPVKINV